MKKTALKEADLLEKVEDFAKTVIFPQRETLIRSPIFPETLWRSFIDYGLAGLSIPADYGGEGAGFQTIAQAGYLLNRFGGVPGVNLTLCSHWTLARLHLLYGTSEQLKEKYLPAIATGTEILSMAISEPGAGAHPKKLSTTAIRNEDRFLLNGEKAFLTNGPLATAYLVLAITSEEKGRRAFSTFLIPSKAEGLQKTTGVELDFLHPCPHGGVRLQNCSIDEENMIGEEGTAFERTSLKMRAVEDALGAASLLGILSHLLYHFARNAPLSTASQIGAIETQLQSLKIVAAHLAKQAEEQPDALDTLLSLYLGFRQQSKTCMTAIKDLYETSPADPSDYISLLLRDVLKFSAIAGSAHNSRLSKVGLAILDANP
ncbi:acyl-CoA dehydrogenase family protein [Sneathiella sp.]|jgi:acyl-CoA dehydrogenase|uniref:acyl-CoA dehydrogenase family protein n=1 Tax=Sneathiella sp. TaxID=1964365 RepID=UPI0039E4EB7A